MQFNREDFISRANVHDQWKDILIDALQSVDTNYLTELVQSNDWLPGLDNIFSAFRRDRLLPFMTPRWTHCGVKRA